MSERKPRSLLLLTQVSPPEISSECLICLSALSLPDLVQATTPVNRVDKLPYLSSLLAKAGCKVLDMGRAIHNESMNKNDITYTNEYKI